MMNLFTYDGSFSRTNSSKSRIKRYPGGAVIEISHSMLSGYCFGNPGLAIAVLDCCLVNTIDLLQSSGHPSSNCSAKIIDSFLYTYIYVYIVTFNADTTCDLKSQNGTLQINYRIRTISLQPFTDKVVRSCTISIIPHKRCS